MDKEFEEFIHKRCSKALTESKKYTKMEADECDQDELSVMAEKLCYIKGVMDVIKFIIKIIIRVF